MSATAGFEAISVGATAVGFTSTSYTPAGKKVKATCFLETANIRFRLDGTDPTASVGQLMQPGYILILESQDEISGFKAIRTGDTSATLTATVIQYT